MKLVSPLPHRRGRLEIIPLIDIMFFLLAAFMLVSIDKIKVKSLKINLPTDVPAAQKEKKEDFVSILINADGQTQIDKELIVSKDALLPKLQALYAQNHDQKLLISADQESRHGDVMRVLGKIRTAGFQKVAFSVKSDGGSGGSAPEAADGAAAPAGDSSAAPATTPAPTEAPAAPSSSAAPAPTPSAAPSAPAPNPAPAPTGQ